MTPERTDYQSHIESIVQAVLVAVDPARCVASALQAHPSPGGAETVIAVGKAAAAMFEGYVSVHGEPTHRFMLAPAGTGAPAWAHVGDHPLPTERNVSAANALVTFVEQMGRSTPGDNSVVVLLSGGASALLTLLCDSVPLDEYREVTQSLMRAGADIHQLNCVRKHAERLKGGRLAQLLWPHPVHALILSDVIGDDLSVIGSGPLSPDPTTFQDALAVLKEFGVGSPGIHDLFARGASGTNTDDHETPKPGDPIFTNVIPEVIANNTTAVRAAADAARALGFHIAHTQVGITGEAAEVGKQIAAHATALSTTEPSAVIFGGETTVNVGDACGIGGPSTELALAAALALENLFGLAKPPRPGTAPGASSDLVIAAFATDGIDGPTDAAGAIITASTPSQARLKDIDPNQALGNHNSYTLLKALNALIRTGPTGTNVNDIVIALRY